MDVVYFAYGSNLDVDQMQERCPSSRPLVPVHLPGHRLSFTHLSKRWGGGAADILPDEGEHVWGALYVLEPEDLERLDRFEAGYEQLRVRVIEVDGNERSAITYTARKKGSFDPTDEYVAKLLCWGEHWGFPAAYLTRIRQLRSADL